MRKDKRNVFDYATFFLVLLEGSFMLVMSVYLMTPGLVLKTILLGFACLLVLLLVRLMRIDTL